MKAIIRNLILAFLSILLPSTLCGQKILYPEYYPPDIRWDNFLLKNGEASQASLSVMIDSKGFIWSGTGMALYRYDGVRDVEYRVNTGTGEGFTGFDVATIFEDHEGTIWIGTSQALNKLDQRTGTFSCYVPDPDDKSDIGNFVRGINEDRDGNFWILTKKHIYSFDRKSEKFTCYVTDSLSWYPGTYDFPVEDQGYAEDKFGNKWFVTFGGLYLFDKSSRNFRMVFPEQHSGKTEPINRVKCVFSDRDGSIWIGTDGSGLSKWDYSGSKPEKIEAHGHGKYQDSFNIVTEILQDRNGSMWIFGNGSFSNYNPWTHTIKRYIFFYNKTSRDGNLDSKISIDQAFQNNDRTIWFLNKITGLVLRFDPVTEKLALYRAPHFAINQCTMDKTGSLWFACNRNNIFRLLNGQIPYYIVPVKTTSHIASIHRGTFVQDMQERVYFLFFQGILVCRNFDISTSLVFDQFRFPDGDVLAGGGFEDSRGNLWFGDKRGNIAWYNPSDRQLRLISHFKAESYSEMVFVPLIREDRNGDIWIANSMGLSRFKIAENKLEHILDFPYEAGDKDFKFLEDFFIDSQDNFWILTNKSILQISKPDMKILDFTDWGNGIFSALRVNIRVAEDTGGNVYVLNARYGIYKFDRVNKSFAKVDTGTEEAGSEYYDLLIDRKNRLWTAQNTGISIYDLRNKRLRLIRTPKLQFDVQSCQLKSGEILFLNDDKLYIFPEDVPLNNFVPPVFLTRVKINGEDYNKTIAGGKEIPSLKRLDLPFRQNTLTFEFAALNFLNPERNMYRYFMMGIDRDTTLVAQGVSADYKSLPPGRYRFWVNGSNNDGLWNSTGVTLDIRIHPPWYRTAVAYLAYFISLSILVQAFIKLRERNLVRDKTKLEAEIKVATAELEKKNFQLAETDRIKTHFFTDISHEIRTPLSLILAPLENLTREETFNSRVSGTIDLMKRNALRLMNLVNQLLDISRLDIGKMKIMLSEEDIVKSIRILVYEFLSLAESKQINYVADLPDREFLTWFDRDKIEKILTNLLSNAFKYTPRKGTVKCTVRIETEDQTINPLLRICVMDTGPGISREHQVKIFDRFYRVEGHSETGGYGTGIGLSLVKEFVLLLHGTVSVKSEDGKGSVFNVSIPLGKDHLSSDEYITTDLPLGVDGIQILAMHPELPEMAIPLPAKENRMKLLIIEDNEDLRKFINESLEEEYLVIESEDGRTGLNTAFTMMPDLIVTDIMMPDIDGIRLCSILKNDERTSHIPVIMLTAKATTEDKIAGLKTGADDYIIKPFNVQELKARISNLLIVRQKLKLKYGKFLISEKENLVPESVDDRFIVKVMAVINDNIQNYLFDVAALSEQLGMSRSHLNRKIRILTGLSPAMLIRNVRLEKAAKLLSCRAGNITEVANRVGMSNPSNFAKVFKNYFGITPKNYFNDKGRQQ